MDSAISAWLEGLGLGRYVAVFAENEIGLEALRLLNGQDLRELCLPLEPTCRISIISTSIQKLGAS